MAARTRQVERQGVVNARLQADGLQRHCALSREGERLLADAIDRLGLSARAFHRILRVARTVADLDGASTVADVHLSEAIAYRRLDRGRT